MWQSNLFHVMLFIYLFIYSSFILLVYFTYAKFSCGLHNYFIFIDKDIKVGQKGRRVNKGKNMSLEQKWQWRSIMGRVRNWGTWHARGAVRNGVSKFHKLSNISLKVGPTFLDLTHVGPRFRFMIHILSPGPTIATTSLCSSTY